MPYDNSGKYNELPRDTRSLEELREEARLIREGKEVKKAGAKVYIVRHAEPLVRDLPLVCDLCKMSLSWKSEEVVEAVSVEGTLLTTHNTLPSYSTFSNHTRSLLTGVNRLNIQTKSVTDHHVSYSESKVSSIGSGNESRLESDLEKVIQQGLEHRLL